MRTALLTLTALCMAAPLHAQGWIEPLPGRIDAGVVKVRTSVTVRVTDRVALIEVEEWFQNRGRAGPGEGDYLYPLPGEAVFGNFSLFQGDQELRGETMDAERARTIYEEIVRRKKDPALIELVGHGLVRARVFPIAPGETRKVTMRYTQVLKRSGDALQFRYAAGGRFAGTAPVGREGPQGPQRIGEPAPLSFTLIAEDGGLFRDAFSPTHDVGVTREDGRMTVRPRAALQGDFALFLPLAGNRVGLTLATHRPSGENGYFMLTLSPAEAAESTVPRDLTAVIDVSGSMSGEKIEQARGALRQLVGSLGPQDRFRLIRFNSGVESWRRDWTGVTPAELRAARQWIDALVPEGGTNISAALAEAFRATSSDSRLPVVVFITDGLPSAGETNPERIATDAERAAGRTRVFAFGVGYDVNTLLLDRLGAATRGSTHYVHPGDDVEQALSVLAARIRHPVLTDLQIDGAPVRLTDVQPRRLPDLFAGEELILFGRYEGQGSGSLAVAGRRSGRAERFTTRAEFPDHETANDFIPRLWASRKLGELAQQVRLNGASSELVEEIRSLALRYGLLSDYTSYIVLEPQTVVATGDGRRERAAASPPPPAASGQAAVQRAEEVRAARSVRTLADMAAVEKNAAARVANGASRPDGTSRVVAGRAFELRNGVWTDVAHDARTRVVTVEPFSAAYFAVLRALPELQPYWKELPGVLVAGREVSIILGSGLASLPGPEVERIARQFRYR